MTGAIRILRGLLVCCALSPIVPAGASVAPQTATPAPNVALQLATPGPNALLAVLPPRLQLLFADELDGEASAVHVTGPGGQRVDRPDQQVDGARMLVSLRDQGPGVYRVAWQAVTEEEKRVARGEYRFTIHPSLPADVPQIGVAPGQAANGASVTVAGSGFAADSAVVLTIGDAEELLTIARTDAGGRFRTPVALPADLPYGRQVVQAADAADHQATCAIWVPEPGGVAVAAVRLSGEAEAGAIAYTLRVENRSDFRLRNVVVRARVPAGTAVLLEGLKGPEGASEAELERGDVVWRLRSLPPHSMQGPFTFSVTTTGLRGRPTVTSEAAIEYTFTDSPPPRVRGQARSPAVNVQMATR